MKVTIELPDRIEQLETFNDETIAFFWHLTQHNPAEIADAAAGEVAEHVAREIIRRWLKGVPPRLWSHQGRHHYWHTLQKHGKWLPVNGDDNNRQWVPAAGGSKAPETLSPG